MIRSHHEGTPVRDAEVLEVEHADGSPPYRVRWSDTGHEALFFPGPDAYIDHVEPSGSVPAATQATPQKIPVKHRELPVE